MAVDAVEAFLEREGRQVWATRCASGGTHVCPLHTRTNLQENPTTCRESLHTMQFWNAKVLLTGTVNCLKFTRVVSGKETSKKEGKAFFLGGGFPVFLKEAPRPHPIVGICQLICLFRQMLQASFPYAGVNCDKVTHYRPKRPATDVFSG